MLQYESKSRRSWSTAISGLPGVPPAVYNHPMLSPEEHWAFTEQGREYLRSLLGGVRSMHRFRWYSVPAFAGISAFALFSFFFAEGTTAWRLWCEGLAAAVVYASLGVLWSRLVIDGYALEAKTHIKRVLARHGLVFDVAGEEPPGSEKGLNALYGQIALDMAKRYPQISQAEGYLPYPPRVRAMDTWLTVTVLAIVIGGFLLMGFLVIPLIAVMFTSSIHDKYGLCSYAALAAIAEALLEAGDSRLSSRRRVGRRAL